MHYFSTLDQRSVASSLRSVAVGRGPPCHVLTTPLLQRGTAPATLISQVTRAEFNKLILVSGDCRPINAFQLFKVVQGYQHLHKSKVHKIPIVTNGDLSSISTRFRDKAVRSPNQPPHLILRSRSNQGGFL